MNGLHIYVLLVSFLALCITVASVVLPINHMAPSESPFKSSGAATITFVDPVHYSIDKKNPCHGEYGETIDFRTYYAAINHRSVKYGHQLWGGAPETPNDTPVGVFTRVAETLASYEDCLHGLEVHP